MRRAGPNFIWFRDKPEYPPGFDGAQPDARSAYYKGYVDAFRVAAQEVGVGPELVYAAQRLHGILAGPDDDWDDVVLVRYPSFSDLRKIIESETYERLASPHRTAAVANWRFIVTGAR